MEKLPNGVDAAVEEEEAAVAEGEDLEEEGLPKGDTTDVEAAVEEDVDAVVVALAIEEGKLLSEDGELKWPNAELP